MNFINDQGSLSNANNSIAAANNRNDVGGGANRDINIINGSIFVGTTPNIAVYPPGPSSSASTTSSHDSRSNILPVNFEPSRSTVVLGRGGNASKSKYYGNRRLKEWILTNFLDMYKLATTRTEKSDIVSQIIDTFQALNSRTCSATTAEASFVPTFVRRDPSTNRWYNVGNGHAGTPATLTILDSF